MSKLIAKKSLFSVLSGWFGNLSAGAVALIIFIPNFTPLNTIAGITTLTYDIGIAIIFLLTAIKLDELSKNE